MAGLSSWEIADIMEDHYGRKPSHSSVLNWARALGSVGWTVSPRESTPGPPSMWISGSSRR